ncbi:MAG: putative Ig domain-containing protein [Verrucomicrobiaceae bacterium]|nr:putative Ig domain-containing protein [Verrucomicrobiaceae bacterium]
MNQFYGWHPITASGGFGGVWIQRISGTLPYSDGTSFGYGYDGNGDLQVGGTPTTAGTYTLVVRAHDVTGYCTDDETFTIIVDPAGGRDRGDKQGFPAVDSWAGTTLYIGNIAADGDATAQLNTTASADDTDADGDDEDLPLPASLTEQQSYSLQVPVHNSTGNNNAKLGVWIDWNGDNDFTDPGEIITNSTIASNGTKTISITPPAGSVGTRYMRVRVLATTSATVQNFGSAASVGEIEDHAIQIQSGVTTDWGDYSGFAGAGNTISTALYLGNSTPTDAESGTTGLLANQDDNTGDDETITIPAFTEGVPSTISINTYRDSTQISAARVGVWVRWFGGSTTLVSDSLVVAANNGTVNVSLTPPAGASGGSAYIRVRLIEGTTPVSISGNLSPLRGEVEDHRFSVAAPINYDFGDFSAFASVRNAASANLYLGNALTDSENGTTTNSTATADDTAGDDEDLTLPSLTAGSATNWAVLITRNSPVASGRLGVWIDWNDSGGIDNSNEIITANTAISLTGTQSYTVPITPPVGSTGTHAMRVRLTEGTSDVTFSINSDVAGEVEDHLITVNPAPLEHDYGDFSGFPSVRNEMSTNLFLGSSGTDSEAGTASNSTATSDDNTGDDEDLILPTLTAGAAVSWPVRVTRNAPVADARLGVWIDWNDNNSPDVAAELITVNTAISATGANDYPVAFTVPANATGTHRMRVRLTAGAADVNFISNSTSLGEVEDYVVTVSCSAPVILPPNSFYPSGFVGQVYPSQQFLVSGGTPVTWSLNPAIPGLSINGSGLLSGTPTAAGTYNATVSATEAGGCSGTTPVNIVIAACAAPTPLLPGDSWTLTVPSGMQSAMWFKDGAPISGATSLSYIVNAPGSYTWKAINADGCLVDGCCADVFIQSCPTIEPATIPSGQVSLTYVQGAPFSANGGTAPYAFSVLSGIPPGLAFDAATNKLTGIPTLAGSYDVVVRLTDAGGCTVSKTFTLIIAPCSGLDIQPVSIADAVLGQSYSRTFTAIGSDLVKTWQIRPSPLPGSVAWWALEANAFDHAGSPSQNGALTGTPTWGAGVIGNALYLNGDDGVDVADHAALNPTSITLEAWVYPTEIAPSSRRWIIGKTNSAGSQGYGLHQLNGSTSVRFWVNHYSTAASGVQTSMQLNAWNHVVGTYNPGAGQLRIYLNGILMQSRTYLTSITHSGTALHIGRSPLVGSYFNGRIDEPVLYSRALIPQEIARRHAAGLGVNGAYPSEYGSTVSRWRADGSVSDSVGTHHGSATVTLTHAPGMAGQSFDFDGADAGINVAHSTAHNSAAFTLEAWVLADEAAPSSSRWIAGKSANGSNGYGLLQPAGTQNVRFFVNDANATTSYTESVLVPGRWNHVVGTFAKPNMRLYVNAYNYVAKSYNVNLVGQTTAFQIGSRGVPDSFFNGRLDDVAYFNAALTAGEVATRFRAMQRINAVIPAGMTFDAINGQLAGTPVPPAAEGEYDFLLRAQDSTGCHGWRVYPDFDLGCSAITISAVPALSAATVGTAVTDVLLTVSGGVAPYTWSVMSGDLPPGLQIQPLTATTARITGIPEQSGSYTFNIQAADAGGCLGHTGPIGPVNVTCPAITVSAGSALTSVMGTAYTQTTSFEATGLTGSFLWSSGSLPTGFSFNPSTRRISTTAAAAMGVYPLTITAADASYPDCSGNITVDWRVCPLITIIAPAFPTFYIGQSQTFALTASDGMGGSSFTWDTLLPGAFPPGVTLSSTGILSGSPTAAGSYNVTLRATNADGCAGTLPVTIVVKGISIGSRVFHDLNDNGVDDDGVPGISGVYVRAFHPGADMQRGGTGADADILIKSTITDSNGNYVLANLPVGPVFIRATPPFAPGPRVSGGVPKEVYDGDDGENYGWQALPGRNLFSPVLTLAPGVQPTSEDGDADTDLTLDFGLWHGTGAGGILWHDQNADGVLGTSEPGLVGVEVQLWWDRLGNDDAEYLLSTTVTDNAGRYSFLGLRSGRYQIVVTEPNFGSGVLGSTGSVTPLRVLADNQSDNDSNGYQPAGTGHAAHSILFLLGNNEEPIGNGTGGSGEFGRGGEMDDAFANGAGDQDVDLTIDMGFLAPGPLSVGNLVFNDTGGSPFTADVGEGLGGIVVELFRSGENPALVPPLASTVTDAVGRYLFQDLYAGTFFVRIHPGHFNLTDGDLRGYQALNNIVVGDDDVGDDTLIATAPHITGIRSHDFTLAVGSAPTAAEGETGDDSASDDGNDTNVDLTIDLGVYHPVSVGNHVFIDANFNGHADAGEGVNGIRVELYRDDQTPGVDTPIHAIDTANGGRYLFDKLHHGTYYVHIPKSQFFPTKPLHRMLSIYEGVVGDDDVGEDGINTTNPANDGVTSSLVPLYPGLAPTNNSGETGVYFQDDDDSDASADLTIDFGFQSPVGIGNMVFIDADTDGYADPGEGVQNVVVELYTDTQIPGVDFPLYTTLTDADGKYYFSYLFNGDYRVHIPAVMFANGQPLHGKLSLVGDSSVTVGIDDNQDEHDNGIDDPAPHINGISSALVHLAISTEPTTNSGETGMFKDIDSADDNNFDLTIDFGFAAPASDLMTLGNVVYEDLDGDGKHDSGEGVNGVTVQLFATGSNPLQDQPLDSTSTATGGNYRFFNLPQGSYFVFIPPAAFDVTNAGPLAGMRSLPGHGLDIGADDSGSPAADENGIDDAAPASNGIRSVDIQLTPDLEPVNTLGETGFLAGQDDADDNNGNLTVDFGFFRSVSVGNIVFHDSDGSGSFESGEGVGNVTVKLFHSGDNPATANPVATVVTNSSGKYFMADLFSGDYFLHIPKEEFISGGQLIGKVSLYGTLIGDDNVGEDGLDDTHPSLHGISSAVFSLIPGYCPQGTDEEGEDGASDDAIDDQVDLTRDFGFANAITVGNMVFKDLDNDALLDQGDEIGVTGVTVQLWTSGNNSVLVGSDVTDSYGRYDFQAAPGSYIIKIPSSNFNTGAALAQHSPSKPTPNYLPTSTAGDDDVGQDGYTTGAPGVDGVMTPVFTLAHGSMPTAGNTESGYFADDDNANDANGDLTIDLGFRPDPLGVGNLVFHDTNGDGIYNAGESGIQNVTLRLYLIGDDPHDPNTVPVSTAISDSTGAWLLTAFIAGDYFIHLPPSNFAAGAPLHGLISSIGQSFDDLEDDDVEVENGLDEDDPATFGINSTQIELLHGTEPVETGFQAGTDNNFETDMDLTIDFGFQTPPPPPSSIVATRILPPLAVTTFASTSLDPLADEDHDAHTNLLEYVLGTDPRSGLLRASLRLHADENGTLSALVTRQVHLPVDARLYLQHRADHDSTWSTLALVPQITQNSDGTVTASYGSLPSAEAGYIRLRAELDADLDGQAEATTHSEVHAWLRRSIMGLETLSMPFTEPDAARGLITGQSGASVQIGLQPILRTEAEYYLEILSGPKSGLRLEIDEKATTGSNLVLDAQTIPTDLLGAPFALRRHVSLASVLPEQHFIADQDRVLFHEVSSDSFRSIPLTAAGWLEQANVLPGQGMLVQAREHTAQIVLIGQIPLVPHHSIAGDRARFIGYAPATFHPGDKLRIYRPATQDYQCLLRTSDAWLDESTQVPITPELPVSQAWFYIPVE